MKTLIQQWCVFFVLVCACTAWASDDFLYMTQSASQKTGHTKDIVKLDTRTDQLVESIEADPYYNHLAVDQYHNFYLSLREYYSPWLTAGKKLDYKRGAFPYLKRTIDLKGSSPTDIILVDDNVLVKMRSVDEKSSDASGFEVYDQQHFRYLKSINLYRDFIDFKWTLDPAHKKLYVLGSEEELLDKEEYINGRLRFYHNDFPNDQPLHTLAAQIRSDFPEFDIHDAHTVSRELAMLNGILREIPDYYDRVVKSRKITLSDEMKALVEKTNGHRSVKDVEFNNELFRATLRLNRLLLEALYPALCPKTIHQNFLHTPYVYQDTTDFVKVPVNYLYEIDLTTFTVLKTWELNTDLCEGIDIHSVEGKLYLSFAEKFPKKTLPSEFPSSSTENHTIEIFDPATGQFLSPLNIEPSRLAYDPQTKQLYIANNRANQLVAMDIPSHRIVATANVSDVFDMAIANHKVYLNSTPGNTGVVGTNAWKLVVMDAKTLKTINTIPGEFGPFGFREE
jgi:hypothetical protein